MSVRVLQSFPHKIGAGRICTTAWHQAADVAHAGGDLTVYAGVVHRPLPSSVRVKTTLARGRWRVPYRAVGLVRALALHDRIVARSLPKLADSIDIVHTWPLAGLQTLRTARRLGITTVVERPNAHTRFAYETVARECRRLGVDLPEDDDHAYNTTRLSKEEEEYDLADYVLCPSDFVAETFRDQGVDPDKLMRHRYGYDEGLYYPAGAEREHQEGLNALFVGVCAVNKGLHFALDAWLRSSASRTGTFRIAGTFPEHYREKLAEKLEHPSIRVLGHRDDVPELMRKSDVMLLPSITEGFGLVCVDSIASGCVPLVSNTGTELCVHERNSLVHTVGDVESIREHITSLDQDRDRLAQLRAGCLASAPNLTWGAAGHRLLEVYEEIAAAGPR